jgi:tetratricopeptide (TPR) repeat protein
MSAERKARIGARLRAERKARSLVVADLAKLFRQVAPDHVRQGLPKLNDIERTIRGHEAGDHAVSERYRLLYARAFEMDEGELFGPSFGGPLFHDPDPLEDDVKRRALLAMLAAAAVTAPLSEEGERQRAELLDAVEPTVTDRDADAWERVAFDYAHEVGQLPAALLLPDLLIDFDELGTLIDRSRNPVRTRLIHSAAYLAALAAIAYVTLGQTRSARRWWRSAAQAADESGNDVTASLVRGRQAVFSLYEDRSPLSILDVAEEAIEIGRNTPCAGVVSGYAAKAQALAQLDRHAEARAALQDLQDMFERLPDTVTSDRSFQWGWTAQRLHHVASHVYTHAGDIERAGAAQDQALALYPERNYQGRTQVELHRAGCLMRAGDVDGGARHTVQVLERLPAEFGRDGLVRRTAMQSLSLAPPAAATRPQVRDAYELLALPQGDQ